MFQNKVTLLHCAADQDHLPIVEVLIRSNADINVATKVTI